MEDVNSNIAVNNKTGYKIVLKQKEYMKLIMANVINRFGDSLDAIAFTWLVFSLTNSAGWSAVIYGVNKVPTIFLQPFAGAMVEGRNKKFIMVFTDIIRGICVSFVAIMFILDMLNPWMLLVTTIVISSAEAFRGPASIAILPKILDKAFYDFGMSLNSTLTNIVELIGLASAGAIIGFWGTHTAIFIDAVTFWGSAIIILFIHTGEEKREKVKLNIRDCLDTLKGGLNYLKTKRVIVNFVLLAMIANAILVPMNSLIAPLVKDVLKQGEYMLSIISFTLMIGMVLGSAVYPYAAKVLKIRMVVFLAGITMSLYYLVFVICGYISDKETLIYVICALSSLITGIASALIIAVLNVQFIKQVETEYLARVGAIMSAGCVGAMPVVSFAVSALIELISISKIFLVVSGIGMVFFLLIFIAKVRFE